MQISLCQNCKFYTGDLTCLAFPERIPDAILLGENNHSKPLPEQDNNIVFVDIKDNTKSIIDFFDLPAS
jgi:hypothetical protein